MFSKKITALILSFCMVASVIYPTSAIKVSANTGDFELFNAGNLAKIYIDSDSTGKSDYKQVVRAGNDLKSDIKAVTSTEPQIVSSKQNLGSKAIIIGTLGKSDLIDELATSGKIDTTQIAGQWEAFTIKVVENPFSGCDSALVIAGSDKRGTIYGIYQLSEAIGVSPWYWWGDVPIRTKTSVILSKSTIETTEKPDVKFRGIFINDEKNLMTWSTKFQNSTTSPGAPNPDMYAKVFELMLRLKSNTLWPAMHSYSTPFNFRVNPATGMPYNAEVADEYGIIMGSSHCEILLRTNEVEWPDWCTKNATKYNLKKIDNDWNASYDYTVNPEGMNNYWRDRVAVNYKYDNLYTIGLRGVHDSGILCRNLSNPTYENKAKVVKAAVEAQVEILEEFEQKYFEETGEHKKFDKIFCPYKEAAEYFKYDLSLPADTNIVYADDNYGYTRAVSDQNALDKYQGGGVYYHISYWGRPTSTLWVASTPIAQMYEELTKTYNSGSNDVFILNVGDIKPGEIPIDFFMQFGWKHDKYNESTLEDFFKGFAKQNFGMDDTTSDTFASLITEYYQTTIAKRPEFQNVSCGSQHSLINYGDEAQIAINKIGDICTRSQSIMDSLNSNQKDSYYQMVQYMIRASKLSFEKNYYQQKNKLYYTQGRFASVNSYAKASLDAYSQILSDITHYNKTLSSGKWDGILNPYKDGIPQIFGAPTLSYVSEINASNGVGSVCEGQTSGSENITLNFNSLTNDHRFIDVFNLGKSQANYKITTDDKIKIITSGNTVLQTKTENGKNVYTGSVNVEDRLWAVVDWDKVSDASSTATITVTDDYSNTKTYNVSIKKSTVNPQTEKLTNNGYYETDGIVSIEAEHYSDNVAVGEKQWKLMPNLGRSGDSMKVYPDLSAATNTARIDSNFATTSPYLEYKVYFDTTGSYIPTLYRLPTLNEGANCTNRTGIQLDNGEVYLFKGTTTATDEDTGPWAENVLNNIEKLSLQDTPLNITSSGWHTIRIFMSDAGIVIDKLTLQTSDKFNKQSHLGAPESFNTISHYAAPVLAKGPDFSLSNITYPQTSQNYYFDFSNDAQTASQGYMGVDNKQQKSALKCYEWDEDGFSDLNAARRTVTKASIRDNGIVYSSKAAGIKFKMQQSGKYLISFAIGDRQSGGVSALDMNVSVNNTELITNLNLQSGRTIEKGFIVNVTDEKLIDVKLSGSWVLSAIEITEYNEPESNKGNLNFIEDSKGNINIEAESALENSQYAKSVPGSDSNNSEWTVTTGTSGYGMFSGPNMDNNFSNTNISQNSGAKLNYSFNIKNTGTYNVWTLVKCQSSDDDSLLVSADSGTAQALNDVHDTLGKFVWMKAGSFSLAKAGEHTLTICQREDGIVLDKIVISKSGTAPSGRGGVMTREKETADFTYLNEKIDKAMTLLGGNYDETDLVSLRLALLRANYLKTKENVTNSEIAEITATITGLLNKISPPTPVSIKITGAPANIDVGKSVNLSAVILPDDSLNKSVKWTSSNKTLLSVNSKGVITAISAGTAIITATTFNGKRTSVTVIVKSHITRVTVKKPIYTLKVNKSLKLTNIIKSINPTEKYALTPKYSLIISKSSKKHLSVKGTTVKALKNGKGKTVTVTVLNNGKKVGYFKVKIT